MADSSAINAYLQDALARKGMNSVDAVTAAKWLDEAGLLADSSSRPGKPLRDLLRAGRIVGQRQALNSRWTIEPARGRATPISAAPDAVAPADATSSSDATPKAKRRDAAALLESVGLDVAGQSTWDKPVRAPYPGVYVVEWPTEADVAPISAAEVAAWIQRVPTLKLDGGRPSVAELTERLKRFWLPDQTVVYVGLTSATVAKRLRAYARTPLGDARPHAGGHWLKTLDHYQKSLVTWAFTDRFADMERSLIAKFAEMATPRDLAGIYDKSIILPFANLTVPGGQRKRHGISGSRLP